jgi:hypothetical protein
MWPEIAFKPNVVWFPDLPYFIIREEEIKGNRKRKVQKDKRGSDKILTESTCVLDAIPSLRGYKRGIMD